MEDFEAELWSVTARLTDTKKKQKRWEEDELVIETWLELGARTMHFCDSGRYLPMVRLWRWEHRDDNLAGQLTVLKRAG